jgi:hypothetical protein
MLVEIIRRSPPECCARTPPLERGRMNQILISLAILGLWALTSLLSRDAQPLPPRPNRGRPGEGPRPDPSFARTDGLGPHQVRGAAERPSGGMTDSRFPSRPLETSLGPRSAPGRGVPSSDDIRILDPGPRGGRQVSGPPGAISPLSAQARGARSQSRRGSRARPSTGPSSASPVEPKRQRALTSQVNQSMAQAMGRPYEGIQLEAPLASLSSLLIPLQTRGASSEHDKRTLPPGPEMDVEAIRGMLASPARLREIAFLGELLKPPVALRPRGRIR